jgi:hypothetical protein
MQLMRQLNDEELTDLLLENDERELLPLVETLPDSLRCATERPEWFWKRQQAEIRGRLAKRQRWFRPAITWAATMALFVLAVLLLRGSPAAPVQQAHADTDQELLVAVEQVVQSDVPYSLEPASLLADEINGGATPQSYTAQKEKHNAE